MPKVEEWRPIAGYEGLYEVSSLGRCRSLTARRPHGGYRPRVIPGRILAQSCEYPAVTLFSKKGCREKIRVHILVARAFVPNTEDLPWVRHLDDDHKNNHYRNLAWGDAKSNGEDRARNGRTTAKVTAADVLEIRRLGALPGRKYGKFAKIARQFKLHVSTVIQIIDRETWAHV